MRWTAKFRSYLTVSHLLLGALVLACLYIVYNIFVWPQTQIPRLSSDHYVLMPQAEGKEKPIITVIAFLDYGCPYCREVHPTITEALEQDGYVRYMPRILPFQDNLAARFVYAAGLQGQFFQAHAVLIKRPQNLQEREVESVAQQLGLNPVRLKTDMYSDSVRVQIAENIVMFEEYGGEATPFFVMEKGVRYVPEGRMPAVTDFLNMFDQSRR